LVSDVKGRILTEITGEQSTDDNIWTEANGVVGARRKLHNEEHHKLYRSLNRMRMIKKAEGKMSRARSTQWAEKESVQCFGGKARRKAATRKTEM
jgi:hypothetical protein